MMNRRWIVLVLFLGASVVAAMGSGRIQASHPNLSWISVLPPLLAVTLAVLTEKIMLSLAVSVLIGGLLSAVPAAPLVFGSWYAGVRAGGSFVLGSVSDPINLQILVFVALVMALIAVILTSGGIKAIVQFLMRYAKGPRSTQIVTALMGMAVFIDDYTNTMIVGSAMRPLGDRNRVSREKLAYLVDATSAPISGLAVISTWIGYEVGLFGKAAESLGIAKDGYALFFDALSFRFYCLFTLIFVLINVFTGKDYGPMAAAERRARELGEIAAPDAKPLTSEGYASAEAHATARPRLLSALLPLGILFAVLLGGLWWDGGGFTRGIFSVFSPLAWRDVISASENNILILACAAGAGLLFAILSAVAFAGVSLSIVGRAIASGLRSSLLPIIILILAWSLKAACDNLQTGGFLAASVSGVISPFWFPSVLFVVAGLTAFATGTSWGTMAILIPTATPIAFQLDGGSYGLVTMMSLAAVLDGAIFGDHCSPISDTTLMSSIFTGCDHLHHVKTQLPYAMTVAALALICGYLPAAAGFSPLLSLGLATLFIGALFVWLHRPASLRRDYAVDF